MGLTPSNRVASVSPRFVPNPPKPSAPTPRRPEPSRSTPVAPPEEPPYFIDESNGETEIVVPEEMKRSVPQSARPTRRVVPPAADVRPEKNEKVDSEITIRTRDENRNENRADVRLSANGFGAASAPWLRLSENELGAIWLDATRGLGFMLPTQASEFCGVRAEAPNAFYVSFPVDRRMQRDYCDGEKGRIASSLAEKLGGPVSFHCVLDETKKASAAPNRNGNSLDGSSGGGSSNERFQRSGGVAASAPRESVRDLYRKVEENEVVRQLKEFFDAELAEVRPSEESR